MKRSEASFADERRHANLEAVKPHEKPGSPPVDVRPEMLIARPVLPSEKISRQAEDKLSHEEDGYVQGDMFMECKSAKLKTGILHPDHIAETASLRSIQPPDVG